jgi:hypothetical protein
MAEAMVFLLLGFAMVAALRLLTEPAIRPETSESS